jgi:hypothetical protein
MSQEERDSFLFSLYQKTNLHSLGLHPGEINQDFGHDAKKFRGIIDRLKYDGYIDWTTTSSMNITVSGIDYIESRSSDEDIQRRRK